MANRLIFLYQLHRVSTRPGMLTVALRGRRTRSGRVTDGGTQEARGSQALVVLG